MQSLLAHRQQACFGGTKRVKKQLTQSGKQFPISVVYGGNKLQSRGLDSLVPWEKLHEYDWTIASVELEAITVQHDKRKSSS